MKTTNRVGNRTCSDYSPFGVEMAGRTESDFFSKIDMDLIPKFNS
jgi:hypothetical protein